MQQKQRPQPPQQQPRPQQQQQQPGITSGQQQQMPARPPIQQQSLFQNAQFQQSTPQFYQAPPPQGPLFQNWQQLFQVPPPQQNIQYQQQGQNQNYQFMSYPTNLSNDRQTYDDDDQIEESVKQLKVKEITSNQPQFNFDTDFNMDVIFNQKFVHQNNQTKQTIPFIVSLKAKDIDTGVEDSEKPSIDLICVIDISGSMQGVKIDLVKQSLKQLISFLSPKDRISLVVFDNRARRILKLTRVTDQNIPVIIQQIDSIQADGGTNINSGLVQSFRIIRDRKYKNQVTTIFCLSDGLDNSAYQQVPASVIEFKNHLENVTIHSFGYGNDHDPELMNMICSQKNGQFYYVENYSKVSDCFIDALGNVASILCTNCKLDVQFQSPQILQGCKITKVYGPNWVASCQGKQYSNQIGYFMSGGKKDFVFEVEIPSSNIIIPDEHKYQSLVKARFTCIDFQGQNILKEVEGGVTFLNAEEESKNVEEKEEVAVEYLRVVGAEAMSDAIRAANQANYKQSADYLDSALKQIQSNKNQNYLQHPVLQQLQKDIVQSKNQMNSRNYQSGGKQFMVQQKNVYMLQVSQPISAPSLYQNTTQMKYQQKKA